MNTSKSTVIIVNSKSVCYSLPAWNYIKYKHKNFIILKVFKVKVVFIFHFDQFLDLGFGTIVDGTTGRSFMYKKKFWAKPVMVNSVKNIFKVSGGVGWQKFSVQMKSEFPFNFSFECKISFHEFPQPLNQWSAIASSQGYKRKTRENSPNYCPN